MGSVGIYLTHCLPLLLLLTFTSFTYNYFFYLPFLYFAHSKCGKRGESQSYSLLLLLTITSFANCAKLACVQSGRVAREGKSILPITPRWHYTRKLFSPSPVRKSINIDSHAQGNSYFLMSFCKGDTFSGVYG